MQPKNTHCLQYLEWNLENLFTLYSAGINDGDYKEITIDGFPQSKRSKDERKAINVLTEFY
jgi:hypothetical protein